MSYTVLESQAIGFNFVSVLQEVLGRLLGMLFQWFDATAYLPDGEYLLDFQHLTNLISTRFL